MASTARQEREGGEARQERIDAILEVIGDSRRADVEALLTDIQTLEQMLRTAVASADPRAFEYQGRHINVLQLANAKYKQITSSDSYIDLSQYFAHRDTSQYQFEQLTKHNKAKKAFEVLIEKALKNLSDILDRQNARVATPDDTINTANREEEEKIAFSGKPEHPEPETWTRQFNEDFDNLVHKYVTEKKPERLRQVFELFINHANFLLVDFLRSNSSMKTEIKGLMSVLLPFLREGANRQKTKHSTIQNLEAILTDPEIMDRTEAEAWVHKLGSKGLEMLSILYFDQLGREKAHTASMSSDWQELYKLDKEDEDFSITSYDFMIDPDSRHRTEKIRGEKKEGAYVYQNARMMRTMMFLMPRMIRDFEDIVHAWGEQDGGKTRNDYDSFMSKSLDYLLLKFKYEIQSKDKRVKKVELDKLRAEVEALKKRVIGIEISNRDDEETRESKKEKIAAYEAMINGWFTNIHASRDNIKITIEREEDFYSGGEDETITIRMEDLETLIQDYEGERDNIEAKRTHERQVLWRTAGRMGTSLGVRQHIFLNNLARGETPGGGIAMHSRFMRIVSPPSQAHYKSYKDLVPNPFVSHFDIDWDYANIGVKGSGVLGSPEKARTIYASNEFTKRVLRQGAPLRKRARVNLGSISNKYDQIETALPSAFGLVILGSRRRAKKKTEIGFEAWDTGLVKFEEFIDKIQGVPGGTLDREEIKKKDDEKLRSDLVSSLQDIIQNMFSPLKASTDWFRWDHIAEYILLYIDKMYRVYRINDSSDQGVIKLTDAIRKTLETGSVNMAGMGTTSFEVIGQDDDGKKLYRVSAGLVATHLNLYSRFRKDRSGNAIITEAQKKEMIKLEAKYRQRDIVGKYEPLKGLGLDQAELPKTQADPKKAEKNSLPDIRDFLLNFIPKTHFVGKFGVGAYLADDATLDSDAIKIMRYRPEFDVAQVISTGMDAFRAKGIELQNKDQIRVLRPRINKAILGLPPEDKK